MKCVFFMIAMSVSVVASAKTEQALSCTLNTSQTSCVIRNPRAIEICRHKVCPVPEFKEVSFEEMATMKNKQLDHVVVIDGSSALLFVK